MTPILTLTPTPIPANSIRELNLDPDALLSAIERLVATDRPRFRRLWAYFRNPLRLHPGCTQRPYRQAQEWGLPARITGEMAGCEPFAGRPAPPIARKEIVIENDIGWRIETMVEYLFGKPLVIRSSAADPARRNLLDRLIQALLAHNGGILFLQQLALLGSVHGFVDVLVKLDPAAAELDEHPDPPSASPAGQRLDEHPRTTFATGKPPVDAQRTVAGSAAVSAAGGSRAGETPAVRQPQDSSPPSSEAATAAPGAERPAQPASHADPAVSADAFAETAGPGADITPHDEAIIRRLARMIRFEIVEPARAVPLLSTEDYRIVLGYAQYYDVPASGARPSLPAGGGGTPEAGTMPALRPWWRRWLDSAQTAMRCDPQTSTITDIMTPAAWQRWVDGRLAARGVNSLGLIPLVHIQNTAIPFQYAGQSDVEPLLPLQDELNTRLSDRAHRLAMQSFKMYLAKGIDNFHELPVGPGRMWSTDNENAQVQVFGGDSDAPSETNHIADVREALDKTSGVSPIAAGAIKDRIGRLTSAAALRVTLIALLSRTDKKRTTYGAGIARLIELALRWLDLRGVFATTPEEREIEIHWPSPLPENEAEKLTEAEQKLRLGVGRDVVLRELGY